jgi:hypothetical protein
VVKQRKRAGENINEKTVISLVMGKQMSGFIGP